MACNGQKKETPRVLCADLYAQIAKSSDNLTINQVKECFQIYAKLLNGVIESSYKSSDLEFCLPNIGTFYFVKKKGRKGKKTYKLPNLLDKDYKQQIIEKEGDGLDYEIIKFRISKNIKNKVKEASKEKWQKIDQT